MTGQALIHQITMICKKHNIEPKDLQIKFEGKDFDYIPEFNEETNVLTYCHSGYLKEIDEDKLNELAREAYPEEYIEIPYHDYVDSEVLRIGFKKGLKEGINKTIQWIYQNLALDEPFPEKQLKEELLNKKYYE